MRARGKHNKLGNQVSLDGPRALTDTMMKNLRAIGPPRHTKEDIEFAKKIQENLRLEIMEQPYDETLTEPDHAYDKFHPADGVNEFT